MRPRSAPFTLLLVLGLGTFVLGGCINTDPGEAPAPLTSLQVYEYRYAGEDVASPDVPHGWMARITNTADHPVAFVVTPLDNGTRYGPAGETGWETLDGPSADLLSPDESKVYLFQQHFTGPPNETGFLVEVLSGAAEADADPEDEAIRERGRFTRTVSWATDPPRVTPHTHVQTATVGVWLNGTSFYTNIPDLNETAAFPYGDADRAAFDGTPLPIYVYDQDNGEQPAGSKDTCHFTTITGYNALLKTQAEGSTNVRWLAPEEAYTRAGAEEHALYGDVLIFMNTVVAYDGELGPLDELPDPQGDCFDTNNTARPPIPPPNRVADPAPAGTEPAITGTPRR